MTTIQIERPPSINDMRERVLLLDKKTIIDLSIVSPVSVYQRSIRIRSDSIPFDSLYRQFNSIHIYITEKQVFFFESLITVMQLAVITCFLGLFSIRPTSLKLQFDTIRFGLFPIESSRIIRPFDPLSDSDAY